MKAKSTPPAFKISALLADDQEIYLTGLSRSVRNLKFVSKVCSAQNGEEVLTLLNNLTFHVVIISMHLPEIKKLHVMKEIKERFPNLKVIGFSDIADATGILSFMEEGAHGFLLKNTTRAEIREAIFDVLSGKMFFSKSVQEVISIFNSDKNLFSSGKLSIFKSARMKKLLLFICQEYTIKEIANKLNITEKAVEKNRAELMRATGSKNAVGLAMYAIKNNIIDKSILKITV